MSLPSDAGSDTRLVAWERVGLVATAVLVLTIPLAVLKWAWTETPPAVEKQATFVGREACKDCHTKAYEAWTGSDHDLAMQEANEKTVLGDFDDATFDHFARTTPCTNSPRRSTNCCSGR